MKYARGEKKLQTNKTKPKTKTETKNQTNKKMGKASPSFKKHLRLRLLLTKPRVLTVIELWEAGDCC